MARGKRRGKAKKGMYTKSGKCRFGKVKRGPRKGKCLKARRSRR